MLKLKNRLLFMVIFVKIVFLICLYRSLSTLTKNLPPDLYCLRIEANATLPLISDANISKGNSIFFMETSCRSHQNGKITILPRQACSVESAALAHPSTPVYLLFSSPGDLDLSDRTPSDRFLTALLRYRNVRLLHVDMERYLNGSLVEKLFTDRTVEDSPYAISHFSDVLRSLTAGKTILLPRQACSVEAAARRHPDTPVYVLFTAPGAYQLAKGEGAKVLKALLAYPNVDLLRLDVTNFVEDTPVRELFLGGQIERSLYAVAHASDVLRFVTMYKYGGIYLDLDMIVMKNLWDLVPNFSGVDTNTSTAIGIMRFSHDGAGHEVAQHCLKELGETYDGKQWGYNGPLLLKRVLSRRCPRAKSISDLTALKDCKGFKIYPRNMFYKINWYERDWFFDPKKMNEIKAVEKESVALHLWNKDSANVKAPLNSDMPILHIARTYCPKVYEQVEGYF